MIDITMIFIFSIFNGNKNIPSRILYSLLNLLGQRCMLWLSDIRHKIDVLLCGNNNLALAFQQRFVVGVSFHWQSILPESVPSTLDYCLHLATMLSFD